MCTVNLLARGRVKRHCLTFGDVIVASASHPELRIQGYDLPKIKMILLIQVRECMVNAGDSFRRLNSYVTFMCKVLVVRILILFVPP
jgi:hypothetical protein